MSDSEIITILILFHLSSYRTLKAFYTQMICKEWRQHFPVVLSCNRFVEREQIVSLKLYLFLNNCRLGDCTGISIIDSTPFGCVATSAREDTKPFGDLPQVAKGLWGGSSVSNYCCPVKVLVHPTFGVMRQSCSAYSLSRKYLSSLKP